jgi:homospermidine synthase
MTERTRVGPCGRALIVGFGGGVGRALTGVLAGTETGRAVASALDEILLVDANAASAAPGLPRARVLEPLRIRSAEDLGSVVRARAVDQVVDASSLGTLDCIRACDALGASYLTTSVEHWPDDHPPWLHLVENILAWRRPRLHRGSHLVGSGMNPGIVNALVFGGIDVLARLVGTAPATGEELGLRSILITEEDSTIDLEEPDGADAFPMTWSPTHCLEELFQPDTVVARDGAVVGLGHRPPDALYRARCGDELIDGMIVPHEEVVTLAGRFPTVELAFIYRLPAAARRALAAFPERDRVEAWPVRRMYPPHTSRLRGRDRVGVLLCSDRWGEMWIGYDVDVAVGRRLGTNATQLQVAAGIVAGWSQLEVRRGIHFVEDLEWQPYLERVDAMLGQPWVVHDPEAPLLSLEQRRVREAEDASRPHA